MSPASKWSFCLHFVSILIKKCFLARFAIHSGSKDNFVINPESGVISVADDGDLSIEESGELYDMEVKVRIIETKLGVLGGHLIQ